MSYDPTTSVTETAPGSVTADTGVTGSHSEGPSSAPSLGPSRADFGPLARSSGMIAAVLCLTAGLRVATTPLLLGMMTLGLAVGCALLAPRDRVMRFPVSLVWIMILSWIVLSYTWSNEPLVSLYFLQRDLPFILAMTIVAGVLPLRDLFQASVWAIRVVVIVTLLAIIAIPEARLHVDPTGMAPDLPGWHGLFGHKNTMTPVLLLGLTAVIAFDRSRVPKWLTLLGIGVLLFGSDSVTGLVGALLILSLWIWIHFYRQFESRLGTAYIVSSVLVAAVALVGVILSLETVVEAYGKDVTLTGRTHIWAAVADAVSQRPVFGYGIGGLLWGTPPSNETAVVWRSIGFQVPHSHNGILDLLVQYGVIGMSLTVSCLIANLVRAWSLLRSSTSHIPAFLTVIGLMIAFISVSEPVLAGTWFIVLALLTQVSIRVKLIDRRRRLLAETATKAHQGELHEVI